MLGHELVLADVNQEVVFLEDFEDGREEGGDDFQGGGGNFCASNEDACGVEDVQLVKVFGHALEAVLSLQKRTCEVLLLVKKLSKLLELLNSDIRVRAEFNVDETDLGFARLLAGPSDGSVALEHLFRRAGSESHLSASRTAGVVAVL